MKKLFFLLVFTLIGSFAFASVTSIQPDRFNGKITINENVENHIKVSFDLGDLSNLNETELSNLLDRLPTPADLDPKLFDECTISYSVTLSVMGQSVTVTASGTAATCEKAGQIARDGVKSEAVAAKKLIMSLI